jgi:hypothetical protein
MRERISKDLTPGTSDRRRATSQKTAPESDPRNTSATIAIPSGVIA